MARITIAHKVCDKQLHAAQETIAALERKLGSLDWTPITPENLPKVGDEVLCGRERREVKEEDLPRFAESWHFHGWTHRRPLNLPNPPSHPKGDE
jgi:hypothetical protein